MKSRTALALTFVLLTASFPANAATVDKKIHEVQKKVHEAHLRLGAKRQELRDHSGLASGLGSRIACAADLL